MPIADGAETRINEGLSEREAKERLLRVGPNLLRNVRSRTLLDIVKDTMHEPTFVLLIIAAGLYLIFGDIGQGLFISAGALASLGLVILQETRTERALRALNALAEPHARVIRAGRTHRIRASEVVPGDIALIAAGERIPADGEILSEQPITVDESLLSGESVPLIKFATASIRDDFSDQSTRAFAGTLVVKGEGIIRVTETGPQTQLGRIGASLISVQSEPTPLQQTSMKLVRQLGLLSIIFCLLVIFVYGTVLNDWMGGALAGITLSIALIPEEFPMVLAVFMALGAWRLAKKRVLVRRGAAVETLGAITSLCVDKTGTLTENRMSVASIWVNGNFHSATDHQSDVATVLAVAALASPVHPLDPMDIALHQATPSAATDLQVTDSDPYSEHPLEPKLLAVINAWRRHSDTLLAAKGAPEAIFEICRMEADLRDRLLKTVKQMADEGLRVLGVASRTLSGVAPNNLAEPTFEFGGLVGFRDPVRSGIANAISTARRAGISVYMITGDHSATARAIAKAAGISVGAGVINGSEIAAMTVADRRECLRTVRVFARVMPEEKLLIVQALKEDGKIVAMTGDGVNDGPALKAAHVGIAMGNRGTDVAREAADIVLLDDSFISIMEGIELGRRIFVNLRKALIFITATHIPIAGLALLPLLLGLPPLFFPVHIILLELAIDPLCALVFEAEPGAPNSMNQPPRDTKITLFGRSELLLSAVQGSVILFGTLAIYVLMLRSDFSPAEARAAAFITLIFSNCTLAFAESAEAGTQFFDRRRMVFWAILGLVLLAILIILMVPSISQIMQISAPSLPILALVSASSIILGGWFGMTKYIFWITRKPVPIDDKP